MRGSFISGGIGAVVWIAFILTIRGQGDEATLGTLWLGGIIAGLVLATCLSVLSVRATWRPGQAAQWTQFWNIVEFLWIVEAGVAILTVVSNGYTAGLPIIQSAYYNDLDASQTRLGMRASAIEKKLCVPHFDDLGLCSAMRNSMSRGFTYSQDAVKSSLRFDDAWARFMAKYPQHPLTQEIWDWWKDYGTQLQVSEGLPLDSQRRLFGRWMAWLLFLNPFFFALIFPFRFGRAVVPLRR